MSSTRQANHHSVHHVGNSAGDTSNRVIERHRVDLVVLDLSGFTRQDSGTGWELRRVVDRFPVERVIFLADRRSDLQFLSGQIREAWQKMAPGSPNSSSQPRTARIAVTDRYQQRVQYQAQGQSQGQPQQVYVQTELKASRKLTRRLVAAAARGYPDRIIHEKPPSVHRPKIGAVVATVSLIGVALAVLFFVLVNRNVNSVTQSSSAGPSPQVSSPGSCHTDTSGCTLGSRDLFRDDTGPDVAELQRELRHLGFYSSGLDRIFGPDTEAAVKNFQTCVGLNPNGVADVSGQATISAIHRASPASVASCLGPPATSPATSPASTATSPTSTATATASPPTSPPVTATATLPSG